MTLSRARAILYCAGGGIGDSLVASVVARALHSRFDQVDALTLGAHAATLERVPDIDCVLVDDGADESRLAGVLRERNYDACVVTWATPRTARVPQAAGIAVRVGQARRLYSHRFTHRVTVRSERGDVTSPWADILLDYARALECETRDMTPRFVPTDGDRMELEEQLDLLGLRNRPFVIVHPTNAIASKREHWPARGWAALARALIKRFGVAVLLTGSNRDAPINAAIVREARARDVVDVAGRLKIGAFGALAQRARVFVGMTTGTMHVAASVGAPTVGIFPFQSDFPERWAPLGNRTAIVRPNYPCHAGDTKESCSDYACIEHLDVARIVAAAGEIAREYGGD